MPVSTDDDRGALVAPRAPGTHVAVVIPTFRAADSIARVIDGIPRLVKTIVVVDDCCPDRSGDIARRTTDSRVRVVRLPENRGVGGATLAGYRAAVAEGATIIVKMDSDDQMDPAYLAALINPIVRGEADYTKGNRFEHLRNLQAMPAVRRTGNLGLSFLTKLASGYWTIFDPTNGYTAIHAAVARQLDTSRIDNRYFFETSMLIELGLMRAVVRDVPIPARYQNERSHLSASSALVSFPPRMIRAFVRRWWIQHFVRNFGVLSLYLVCGVPILGFGIAFGAYHWSRNAAAGILTPTGTIMFATLTTVIGVQLLLEAIALDVQASPQSPLYPTLDLIPDPAQVAEEAAGIRAS